MRLWSLHPKYLDPIGLVALWREGLLAKKVLEGRTKGYKHHPQLERFRQFSEPIKAINILLSYVNKESQARGYSFDSSKIIITEQSGIIPVTDGQIVYEFNHLRKKLKKRNSLFYQKLKPLSPDRIICNPVFRKINGEVEGWEKRSRAML